MASDPGRAVEQNARDERHEDGGGVTDDRHQPHSGPGGDGHRWHGVQAFDAVNRSEAV